jgi:hypothetical protein
VDQIRNATGEKTGSQMGRETWATAGKHSRLTSDVATSAVPWCRWKDEV